MAPPHNQPTQVRLSSQPSFSSEHRHRRCSKAQMCFFKILHIISVLPAADVTDTNCLSNEDEICENIGFDVDLNICLRPPTEIKPFETPATVNGDENCVNDRSKTESNVAEESELAVEEERATEHSEISHVGDQSSGIDYNGVGVVEEEEEEEEEQRDEGYLGLLIEAAELILGDETAKVKKPPARTASAAARGGAKRKHQYWTAAAEAEWYAEFEDTSPVVKSKRGRNQVLPYKYRDSVVEPLVRWSTPVSHRSISNASKRRSK